MNKLKTLLSIVLIALSTIALSSCDEDEITAYNIDGVWTGYITDTNLEKTYSTFFFCKTGDTSGYGYERDQDGWISSSKTRFTWSIKNGNIYMDYGSEGIYVIDYDDFPNSSSIGETFSGIFVDYESGERTARFDLTKKSNNYNDFDEYYYSKKVEINADKDSVIAK